MRAAGWTLARAEPPCLYRRVVLREIQAALALPPPVVWVPTLAASLIAFALNDLIPWDIPVVVVLFGSWIARTALHRRGLLAKATLADLALREELGTGWLVDLIVLRGAAPTGTDRGMLWLEEGHLLFVGHRTSFSLDPTQVAGPCRWTRAIPGLRHGLVLPLGGRLALSLATEDRAEVAAMIDAWTLRSTDARGQGPPLGIGPGALPTTGLFACALATTLAWGGIAHLLFRYHDEPDVLIGVAFAVYAAWGVGLTRPILRWRAWWDRMGLAASTVEVRRR